MISSRSCKLQKTLLLILRSVSIYSVKRRRSFSSTKYHYYVRMMICSNAVHAVQTTVLCKPCSLPSQPQCPHIGSFTFGVIHYDVGRFLLRLLLWLIHLHIYIVALWWPDLKSLHCKASSFRVIICSNLQLGFYN